jgi:gliding motility-associated-like protein
MNWIKFNLVLLGLLITGVYFSQCNNSGNTSPVQGNTYNYSFQCGGCTNNQSGCLYLVGLQAGETIIVNGTTYNGPFTALTGNCTSGANWIIFSVTYVTTVSNISIGMETDGFHCGPAGQVDQIFNISASSCLSPPRPNVVSGPSTVCVGGGPYNFSTFSSGAGSYNWSYSGGGTPFGSGSSINFSPTSSGTLSVTATNSCGTSAPRNFVITVNSVPATPGIISGTTPVCSGTSTTYSISAVSGATSYTWSYSGGGTPSGSGISITLSPTSSGTLSITATNSCGTSSASTRVITVNNNSIAPTGITGANTICSGSSTTLTLSGGSAGTGATAQWFSGSCGGTAAGTGNSITVSPTSNTTYFVRYSGTCNTTICASIVITVNSAPATPAAISGTSPVCTGTSQTYSVTAVSGATSYTWSYSGGGTATSTTNSVTFTPTSSGTLSVTATNACGTSSARTRAIVVNSTPATPGVIAGTSPVCSGTSQTYSISAVSGATSYTWNYSGVGIATSSTTGVTFTPMGSGTLSVTATNSCGTSSVQILNIVVNAAPSTPGAISGTSPVCTGTSQTYSVTAVSGATSYTWSYSGGGAATSTTNSVTFTPTSSGTLSVTATNACGTSTVRTRAIVVNATPAIPGAISGTSPVCTGTSQTYSVTAVSGATSYTWSYSGGGTATSTTNSVTFTPTSSGTLSVTATNTCGTSSARARAIVVNATPATPGTISGTSPVCSGVSQTYSISAVSGATSYTWSYSGGGTATSSTTAVMFTPTSSGTLSVTATNACGTSIAATFPITVNSAPATPGIISGATPFCEGTSQSYSILAVSGAASYTWSYSGGGTAASSTTGVTFTPTSSGTLSVTATNTCGTSAARTLAITVNINSIAPTGISGTTTICTGSSTTLTLSGGTSGTGASAEWFTGSCGGTAAGTGNSITVSPTANTTYFVRYTGTCNTTTCVSQLVTVNPTDDGSFSYSGGTYCLSGVDPIPTITGLSGGTFSINNGGSINASTGEINLTASGVNSYTVSYLTNGSCPTTATAAVSITSAPTAGFSYTGTPYCSNGSNPVVTFTAGASGGVFSDFGATGDLTINSGTGEIDLSSSLPGTYTVENDIVAAGGCAAANATTSVTITLADDASFTLSSGSECQNGTDVIASISVTTGGTFTATPAGLSMNSSTGAIDVSASAGNAYVVTYTTGGTCPDVATQNITITTADDATFTLTSTSSCQNATDITSTITGTIGGTFSSSPAVGLSLNGTTGDVDVSASTPGTYDITYTTLGTCPETLTLSVVITLTDDATFSYSGSTYCLSGTDPTPTITGLAGGTFTSAPAGLVLNGSTGEITLATSAINTYDVTYTTTGPCPEGMTVQVTVTSAPTADFNYPNALYCQDNGGSSVATVTFNPGASGGVFTDQGATGNLVINGSTGDIDLALSVPGTYIVENNIVAAGGCAAANATTSITITQQDDPGFNYTTSSFCQGDGNPLATITGTAGGNFTSAPAGLVINGTTGEVDVATSTLDVTYTITYTTTGTCPDSQDATLIINSAPTTPTVTTSVVGNTICIGESIDITASGSGTSITYNVYDALTGGTLLGVTDLTVSPTVTTDYFVEAVNTAGCAPSSGREVVTITVNPLPSIDAGTDETICPGDVVTLTATGTGMYSWSTTETTQSIDVSPITTTTYTVTLTDANTCVNSATVDVNVNATGAVLVAVDDSYNVDFEVLTNLDVLSNDTVSATVTTIIIDPLNGVTSVQTDGSVDYTGNTGYTGADSFTYIVCEALCATICDTATVSIEVENNDLEVPGGFSPNGDNINDLFVINGLSSYPNNHLQIFNRWGDLVYNAQPYNNDWDGSSTEAGVLLGDKVTSGTYFYILDLGDGNTVLRGSIEVKWN